MYYRLIILFLPLCLCQQLQTLHAQAPLPDDFDDWIEEGMEQWNIPGMAIAVVHEDDVIYARGFGVRKLGEESPVNEHTLFGIAALTKGMTSAALALLVDDGLLEWDDRVSDILPGFELMDPWVTEEVRVRDLLTHRVGLGPLLGNRLQYMTGIPREELIYRLRYQEFEEPFRSEFVYNNVMYMVAAEVIPAVTGRSWDEFVRERLLDQSGLQRATTGITALQDSENAAWPHQSIRGEIVAIPRRNMENAAPAAGVHASAWEMAQWLRLHLDEPGVYDGEEVISREQMLEMHRPQMATRLTDPYSEQVSYGLGWSISDYLGVRTISHWGSTDGMNAQISFMPRAGIGIVVLSNVFNSFKDAIVNTVYDSFLDVSGRDWNRIFWQDYREQLARAVDQRNEIEEARESAARPTHSLDEYTGIYEDELYGMAEISIHEESGNLILRFGDSNEQIADLEHWHHDTFRAIWRNPARREEFLFFTMGQYFEVASLNFQYALRPLMIQVGAYPTDDDRIVEFEKIR